MMTFLAVFQREKLMPAPPFQGRLYRFFLYEQRFERCGFAQNDD